jgi:hypothetical protein
MRYKLWRGAWLKQSASVTHCVSHTASLGSDYRMGSATSARPTLHVGSAVCSQSGHMGLFGIEQRNDLHAAKHLWPFLCLF